MRVPTRMTRGAALALGLTLSAVSPVAAEDAARVSHLGSIQARSGASVSQNPQRIRTSFDMSTPRIQGRVSREDLSNRAVPIPRQMQEIPQQSDPVALVDQDAAPVRQSRVRVLGAAGDQTVASVRQSRVPSSYSAREDREIAQEATQTIPSYVQYNGSADPTFDFSFAPPIGGVLCDGLPMGVDRFTVDGTVYYAYAGSCLTRIYQGGVVCYRVVPCPPH